MRRRSVKTTQILLWIISFLVIAGMLCGVLASLFAPRDVSGVLPAIAWSAAFL